uniref:Anoctamin transmembrane domain-containing protein n=1 Tax=Alexandrium monilatum TaxID=311494 RepID=A0A7S4VAW0_9DINO|mmetsp:Transcript_69413/g.206788  ORF Transcript_69413/g.206788 Transcript_69413/m.206788 type:complete len:781 (-) Transcript_69413:29-2371(-)
MNSHDWLFIFGLPQEKHSEPSPESKQGRARDGGSDRLSTLYAHVLCHAFREVLSEDASHVEELRQELTASWPSEAETHGRVIGAAVDKTLSAPLLDTAPGSPPSGRSVRQRAKQCTIDLFLATLRGLDACLRKAIEQESGQDPGTQIGILAFPDENHKSLYVAVSIASQGAEILAECIQYPVQLSAQGASQIGLEFDPTAGGHTLAHVRFSRDIREKCQQVMCRHSGQMVILRSIDRVRLLREKLTDLVDMVSLARYGFLKGLTPLHNKDDLAQFHATYSHLFVLFTKDHHHGHIEHLRQYFGEEMALYFLFLRQLAWWSLYLSIPTTIGWIASQVYPGRGIFFVLSVLICTWLRAFTLSWYRRELQCLTAWDARKHTESAEMDIPNLRLHSALATLSAEKHPKQLETPGNLWKVLGLTSSAVLTTLFVLALLGLVGYEHLVYLQLAEKHKGQALWEQALSTGLGALTGIQIKVMDAVWDKVSTRITDLELRETEAAFLASKRFKASIVRFITSVSTMLYFAFVEPTALSNTDRGIFRKRLARQLMAQFFTRFIVLGSFNRVVKTYVSLRFRHYMHGKRELTFLEVQALMEEYGSKGLDGDFLDILIPLAIVAMFGMVGPPVVLLLLLLTVLEFRADAWKLVHTQRRPFPRAVRDLGFFDDALGFIGRVAVFTHCGALCVLWGKQPRVALAVAVLGLSTWEFIGWLVPIQTKFQRIEEQQHSAQSRQLLKLRKTAAGKVRVDLPATEPGSFTDYSKLQRPVVSRPSQALVREGLHLGEKV